MLLHVLWFGGVLLVSIAPRMPESFPEGRARGFIRLGSVSLWVLAAMVCDLGVLTAFLGARCDVSLIVD